MANDDDFLNELQEAIDIFIQRLPGMFTEICEAWDARDMDKLHGLLHDLKGTSGNFGYEELYEYSKSMEDMLKANETEKFAQSLKQAEVIIQSVLSNPGQSSLML